MPSNIPSPISSAGAELSKTTAHLKQDLTTLWSTLEHWQRDNHYIQRGYRPASASYTASLLSLTHLHNESVNIYTHLLGALSFLLAAIPLFSTYLVPPRADARDVYVFAAFVAGAVCCLSASAAFHTLSNHSRAVQAWGNKLDYLGIVGLIWGSFVPSVYFGFGACHPHLVVRYLTMITTLALACAIVACLDRFRTPSMRPFRAAMFAGLGLSAVVPVFHGVGLYGVAGMRDLMSLNWLVAHGIMYLCGAGLYAARIPERFAPGRFDIWGSSHQIFHVLVLAAAVTHFVGLLKAFEFHHSDFGAKVLCAT